MESFDKTVDSFLAPLKNEYVSAVVAIILILYAGLAAPKLPESIARIFDYAAFKLIFFFLIVYMSKKNPTVAIIAAVGVLISLMTLSTYKFNSEMMDVALGADRRQFMMGACDCVCKTCGNQECTCGCNKMSTSQPKRSYNVADKASLVGIEESPTLANIEEASMQPQVGVNKAVFEEEKVNAVLAKVNELKQKLKRDLTPDELRMLSDEVTKYYDSEAFTDNTVAALREKVAHRKQALSVAGFDDSPIYASINN